MPSQQDRPETKNGYLDTEPDSMFRTFEEMMAALRPPPPEPKEVKHVILDADDTMWDINPWGLATIATPVGKTKGNTLPARLNIEEMAAFVMPEYWQEVKPTGVIRLDPNLRSTLAQLKAKGIPVSIASQNDKASIMKYLEAFGLEDQITDVEANILDSKDKMVRDIARRQKVDPAKILFVDNNPVNCQEVATFTDATALALGYHIATLDELLEFIL